MATNNLRGLRSDHSYPIVAGVFKQKPRPLLVFGQKLVFPRFTGRVFASDRWCNGWCGSQQRRLHQTLQSKIWHTWNAADLDVVGSRLVWNFKPNVQNVGQESWKKADCIGVWCRQWRCVCQLASRFLQSTQLLRSPQPYLEQTICRAFETGIQHKPTFPNDRKHECNQAKQTLCPAVGNQVYRRCDKSRQLF